MESPTLWLSDQLFATGQPGNNDSWLNMIVRKDLAEINMLLPEVQRSACLLTEMAEFLCRASEVLAQLAYRIANGEHIHTYAKININQMGRHSDLSELRKLDELDVKHTSLRYLASKLDHTSKDIKDHWHSCMASIRDQAESNTVSERPGTFPPSQETHHMGQQTSYPTAPSFENEMMLPLDLPEEIDETHPKSFTEASEPIKARVESMLDSTAERGKGEYYCPFGDTCTKGGVAINGSPIMFARNSAFRAHLEKHLKRYKCTLPGCPSKTGFSREDLLRRHQAVVPHTVT